MTQTVSVDATLPGLSGVITSISYSGCCAIFKNGLLVGNGALLWTGKHILTAARVVDGALPGELTFKFDSNLPYAAPNVIAITLHPDYNPTQFYNHNIALIELLSEMSSSLSRYNFHLKMDASMQTFTRRVYGRTMDPISGEYITI